jgi:chitinase
MQIDLGRQFYCCPIPEAVDGQGINCGWKDSCSSDQTLMTFAGTFLEDIDPLVSLAGLVGEALANALDGLDIKNEKQYCCSNEEAPNWKDCYWAVSPSETLLRQIQILILWCD